MTAILLNCARAGELEQIRICFYTLFFQLFSILVATLASYLHSQLSSIDAIFAMSLVLSPTTMHLFSLSTIKPSQWFKHPMNANTVYIVLTAGLFVVLYVISVVRVAAGCQSTGFGSSERPALNPSFVIPAILCLVLHIFQIPRSYIVRCMVQVWYLPWFPFKHILGFASTLLLALQMFGVWEVQCVRDEWRHRLGSLFPSSKSLSRLTVYHRGTSASLYGFHGAHTVLQGRSGSKCSQCCPLGHSHFPTRHYVSLGHKNCILHW